MTAGSWAQAFADPIPLPDGGELVNLIEAGRYIAAQPAATQKRPEWQAATEALLLVAERGGDTMLARIGIMRALNAGKHPPPLAPRRKREKTYRVVS